MEENKNSTTGASTTTNKVQSAIAENTELQSVVSFFKKYQNYIFIGLGVIALGVLAYMFLGKKGDGAKAMKYDLALRQGSYYASLDSVGAWNMALDGDNKDFIGLKNIIKKASGTSTEKLARVQAAVCYLKKNQPKDAIKMLESANGFGKQLNARRLFLMGDANAILAFENNGTNAKFLNEAVSKYKAAANEFPEDLSGASYLKRAVEALDKANKPEEAKEICLKIKEKYVENEEVITSIDKYLAKYGVIN
jgi:tetratricopeptide (TPR) repeat protein